MSETYTSMDNEKNNAQTIAELAAQGFTVKYLGDEEIPILIVPPGHKVESLESFLPVPARIKAKRTFIALESFNRYVKQFKSADTRIELQPSGCAVAIIDASGLNKPEWEGHLATFNVTHSERWKTWDSKHKRSLTQKEFAEFVEDNLIDFFVPKGAAMLDIAQTLQAEQNSLFESAVRTDKGDVSLTYKKTTTGKAGQKGDLEIPSLFEIRIPILEGEEPRLIPMRLRYDLNEGKLSLTYEILRRSALLEEVRRSIYAVIKNETTIDPFLVP